MPIRLREDNMKVRRSTRLAAWWIAALVVSAAAQAGAVHKSPLDLDKFEVTAEGPSAMSAQELVALERQPFAEQRRRTDAVLATHPGDFVARLLRTQAEIQLEDYPAVLTDSEALLARASLDRRLRLLLLDWRAEALIQVKREAEAVLVANQALEIDAANAQALFARGWARYLGLAGQQDSALADLDRALQLDPDEAAGYYRRATILAIQGKFDGAARDLERALQLMPDDVPSHLQYGSVLIQRQEYQRALAQFDAAVRLKPHDPSPRAKRAQTYALLQRYDEASTEATKAIELGAADDDLMQALSARSGASLHAGDVAGASRDLDRAALSEPPSVQGLLSRALLRMQMDDWRGAKVDLDRALQIDPDDALALALRAGVHAQAGARDSALLDAQRAVELAPGDTKVRLMRAQVLGQLGQFEEALEQADAIVRREPGEVGAWLARAQMYEALNRHAEGASDMTHVIETGMHPDLPAMRFQRGIMRYHAGDLDGAAADFRAASDSGSSQAEALKFLAVTLEAQQDFAGAAHEYQRSLTLRADRDAAAGLARMQWFTGQFQQAIDFYREQAASPKSVPYTPLWLFIVRARANPADEAAAKVELAALMPAHQPHVWTDTLATLMLGRSSLEAALAEAATAPTDKLRAGERCEADYYAAESLLMHGQEAPATRLLEDALGVCPRTYLEAHATDAERRLLAAKASRR